MERLATDWATLHSQRRHRADVEAQQRPALTKARVEVTRRLVDQANYLYAEAARAREDQARGKRVRVSPTTLEQRAETLEARKAARLADLDAEATFAARPPVILSAALILPAGLLHAGPGDEHDAAPPPHAHEVDTTVSERRAVDAVLAAERALGRSPVEQAHSNPGFDILSTEVDGHQIRIEVKGRIAGADTVHVTLNEVLLGKNAAPRYRLALVTLDPDDPTKDEARYLHDPFARTELDSYTDSVTLKWQKLWAHARPPF